MASTKIVSGGTVQPGVEKIIDPTHSAARFSLRPLEYAGLVNGGQVLDHYRLALKGGSITSAAANAPLASLRWTDASRLCIIERIQVGAFLSAGTTVINVDFNLFKFTGSSGNASGGTSAAMASSGKMKTAMGNSLMGDVRIAATTTIVAATGKTNDSVGIGYAMLPTVVPG